MDIPKLDTSRIKPLAPERTDELMARIEKGMPREERLAMVEYLEKHPSALSSWDRDISFEEYARRARVEA